MVMNCITRVVNWTVFYIKTIRGVAGVLVIIKRIFSKIYLFNRALAANKCNNTISINPP
jgi:hypothetical protein